jgi:ABC-type Fe3+/spermidine/putrescine transport system ATPase subunit
MNKGKIIQVGAPQEIFDEPLTRFVAEFIGKTNILPGRLEAENKVRLSAGLSVKVASPSNIGGGETFVCIRPHNLVLVGSESEAHDLAVGGYNVFSGMIQRRIYFGDAIDYLIALVPNGAALRVVAPPSQRYEKGHTVYALARPEHCVVVSEE